MSNNYYDHTTYPTAGSFGSSSALRAELNAIEAGFDKLPTLTGNGYKIVRVNADGTAMEAVAAITNVTFDGLVGSVTPAAGVFTTLGSTGAATLDSLTVTTDLTVGDDLTVTDDANIGGDLAVTGNITGPTITAKADKDGETYGGVHDFSAATSVLVPTATLAGQAVNKGLLDATALNTALPGQFLGLLISDGAPTPTPSFSQTLTGFALNEVKGADIASAATINLTTATGNLVDVTGTTAITAITLPEGAERTIRFTGALTFTHGASLLLPGAANITTAAGDFATVRGYAAGVVRCVTYTKVSGLAVTAPTAGMTLLATLTPTAAAAVNSLNVFTSAYNRYLIIGEGIYNSTNASNLLMRLAVAGALDTGSNYYRSGSFSTTAATVGSTSISINITNTVWNAGLGINFAIEVLNTNDAATLKSVFSRANYQHGVAPNYTTDVVACAYPAANALTGVGFLWGSGANFAAQGSIRIYGISNT